MGDILTQIQDEMDKVLHIPPLENPQATKSPTIKETGVEPNLSHLNTNKQNPHSS
jgi:hypothetical protein